MTLKVSPQLQLPIAIAGESTAILAKKGAGKSNTAKVIVEEVLDHGGVQVVALDPIGHWWSLRAGADGKPKGGYAVAVFGGEHGDLPLEETAGKLIAQTAVESGQSLVLDVSSLDSNGAMQRFVYDLLEELYRLKQRKPSPLLLVLEEADEFAPQDPKGKNVPRMVGAANRISKRGRGRGIGMLYVTQRSAALNKNVLDQADTLIVMRTIGPRDRTAIESWVKHQDAIGMDEVIPSLPSLATGEAWVWTPERGLLERVKFRKARTYDSSQTPKPGAAEIVAEVKPIDVDALGEAIRATAERAKANDPAELKKRIAELERQLAGATTYTRSEPVTVEVEKVVEVRVEVPVLDYEKFFAAQDAIKLEPLSELLEHLGNVRQSIYDGLEQAREIAARAETAERREPPRRPVAAVREAPARPPSPPTPRADAFDRGGQVTHTHDGDLPLAAARLLTVLAQFPDGRTAKKLAVLAGYKVGGSSYRGGMAELRKRGYVSAPGAEPITATPEGLAVAPAEPLPTGRALYEHWRGQLPEAARRMLDLLYEHWPRGYDRDELAIAAGYEPGGSSYRGGMSALRNLDLATPAGVDPIRASDELMEEA